MGQDAALHGRGGILLGATVLQLGRARPSRRALREYAPLEPVTPPGHARRRRPALPRVRVSRPPPVYFEGGGRARHAWAGVAHGWDINARIVQLYSRYLGYRIGGKLRMKFAAAHMEVAGQQKIG
jgi:hypothetical protein